VSGLKGRGGIGLPERVRFCTTPTGELDVDLSGPLKLGPITIRPKRTYGPEMAASSRTWAWVALAMLAAGVVALGLAALRWYGAPLVPIDLLALLFYLPWWLIWMPAWGFWLLFSAMEVGGGRWAWRWICGGALTLLFLWDAIGAIEAFSPDPNGQAYASAATGLVALAAAPLFICSLFVLDSFARFC
jgi:hypothetical protein